MRDFPRNMMRETFIMRRRVLLIATVPVLAALLTAAVLVLHPSYASAKGLVRFRASISETFTAAPCGTWSRCIHAVGTGHAIHMGKVSEDATIVVDTNPADLQNGCAPETRTTKLTAANGDTITMHGTGFSCDATSSAHDNYIITGGTGRFRGARGWGNESNTHTFTGPGVGVASVSYKGNISSVRICKS